MASTSTSSSSSASSPSWFGSFSSWLTPNDARPRPPVSSSTAANTGSTALRPHERRLLEEKDPDAKPGKSLQPRPSTTSNPNRNKIIFSAGLTFFAFSMLITRRSFARRRLATQAPFYTNAPSHTADQATKVSGAMEAVEALNIATINVLSVAMMATGGALWYFDINSMDEARRMLRGGLGVDGSGRSEQEAEEDFEEWIARTLSRGEEKDAAKRAVTGRSERDG